MGSKNTWTSGIVRIGLIWLIISSATTIPALAEQQSNREKVGLIGPVRAVVERMRIVEEKCFLFSITNTYDFQGRVVETEVVFPDPCEPNTEFKGRTFYTYDDKGAT